MATGWSYWTIPFPSVHTLCEWVLSNTPFAMIWGLLIYINRLIPNRLSRHFSQLHRFFSMSKELQVRNFSLFAITITEVMLLILHKIKYWHVYSNEKKLIQTYCDNTNVVVVVIWCNMINSSPIIVRNDFFCFVYLTGFKVNASYYHRHTR